MSSSVAVNKLIEYLRIKSVHPTPDYGNAASADRSNKLRAETSLTSVAVQPCLFQTPLSTSSKRMPRRSASTAAKRSLFIPAEPCSSWPTLANRLRSPPSCSTRTPTSFRLTTWAPFCLAPGFVSLVAVLRLEPLEVRSLRRQAIRKRRHLRPWCPRHEISWNSVSPHPSPGTFDAKEIDR